MPAPEAILAELGGADPLVTSLIQGIGPLIVPFDSLTEVDGWHVDLLHSGPGAPFDDPSLAIEQRAANALLVACDYAIRRGAETLDQVLAIIRRESPVSIGGAARLASPVRSLLEQMEIIGPSPPAFQRRSRGHALSRPITSDPALSFQTRSLDRKIGDNALSSLIVHTEGRADQLSIDGKPSARWAVEVGLPSDVPIDDLEEIEREVAVMPSFLPRLSSYLDDDGIVLAWRAGRRPDLNHVGVAIHAWTKALFDLAGADVRIVFAPALGESTLLTKMRARARASRSYRKAAGFSGAKPRPPT